MFALKHGLRCQWPWLAAAGWVGAGWEPPPPRGIKKKTFFCGWLLLAGWGWVGAPTAARNQKKTFFSR